MLSIPWFGCRVDRGPRISFILLLMIGLLGATTRLAVAQLYTLNSRNSRLEINTSQQATGYDWIVDGVHHLHELSNWYRVGSTGPESSVHTLNVSAGVLSDRDFDGSMETVTVPYSDPLGRFALEIDYSVFGGVLGSGMSAFDEEIRITNLQQTPLAFHFFEYVDLDLHETPNDDTILLTSQTSLRQFDALTVGNWSFDADRYELDFVPNTVTKLAGTTTTNLASVWPAGIGPVGPGNVAWALQWDFVGSTLPRPAIPPGQTAIIRKEGLLQMQVVPEPAGPVLAILGGLTLLIIRRRQSFLSTRGWLCPAATAAVIFVATAVDARADDLSPPNWTRRAPLTTIQEWEFLTSTPFGGSTPPDGTTAGINPFHNGGGLPLASPGPGVTWSPSHVVNFPGNPVVMSGIYTGNGTSGSYIDFAIPNWIDFESVKHLRLQVAGLWAPTPLPTTSFVSATDNQPGPVTARFVGDGFSPLAISVEFHRYFDWDLFPNPDNEVFRLHVPQGVIVDQVVIDTISTSVPEPISVALFLPGLLGLGMIRLRPRAGCCARVPRN